MVDDPAGLGVEPRRRPRPPPRAGRGRRPRRTCAAPGRTARGGASNVGRPGDAGAGQPADLEPALEPVRLGAGADRRRLQRRGTSALTQGQAPTSGPLADGWTVPSGLSTRGPTRPPSSERRRREPVEAVVEQLGVGVEQHGRPRRPPRHAGVGGGAEADVLVEADEPARALPARRRRLGRVGRRVVDDDQLLARRRGVGSSSPPGCAGAPRTPR